MLCFRLNTAFPWPIPLYVPNQGTTLPLSPLSLLVGQRNQVPKAALRRASREAQPMQVPSPGYQSSPITFKSSRLKEDGLYLGQQEAFRISGGAAPFFCPRPLSDSQVLTRFILVGRFGDSGCWMGSCQLQRRF